MEGEVQVEVEVEVCGRAGGRMCTLKLFSLGLTPSLPPCLLILMSTIAPTQSLALSIRPFPTKVVGAVDVKCHSTQP